MSEAPASQFVDRRRNQAAAPAQVERRQFGGSREHYSPEARELAEAIDQYKIRTGKRYINVEDVLRVIKSLGYHR